MKTDETKKKNMNEVPYKKQVELSRLDTGLCLAYGTRGGVGVVQWYGEFGGFGR